MQNVQYTSLSATVSDDATRHALIKAMVQINVQEESGITFDQEPANPFLKLIKRNIKMSQDIEKNYALEQAITQGKSIFNMVAALEIDYDRLEELKAEETLDESEREELEELLQQAGECENSDDAQQAIQDDPLSVEVRSNWQSVGYTLEPSEFMVLLCTGGPAVRILGELDQYNQPCRAWIEYQDWGTSWTRLIDDAPSQETLLTYCQQFYFGE